MSENRGSDRERIKTMALKTIAVNLDKLLDEENIEYEDEIIALLEEEKRKAREEAEEWEAK